MATLWISINLVKQNPPSNGDFKCHKLIYKNTFFGAKECQACGLSVYGTLDGAREAQAALPTLKKKYPLIARGRVTSESGKILETPSDQSKTHITWWVYANIKAHTMFTVIG